MSASAGQWHNVSATLDPLVDGILQGSAWNTGAPLSYSFPNDISAFQNYPEAPTDWAYAGNLSGAFSQVTSAQQTLIRRHLNTVEELTLLQFYEAANNSQANLRFTNYTDPFPSAGAFGFYPNWGAPDGPTGLAGDVWFGGTAAWRAPGRLGEYNNLQVLHEIGHALGLKHGMELGGVAGAALPDDWGGVPWSIMDYRPYPNGNNGGAERFPDGFQPLDIQALQFLYGANYATRDGNTVYSWRPNTGETFVSEDGATAVSLGAVYLNRIYTTIWDGNGNDTYDFSAYLDNGVSVDLRPGKGSTASPAQLVKLTAPGGGATTYQLFNIYNPFLHENDTRSLIEKAIGGAKDDYIVGNQADNLLIGGGGGDTIDGLDGDDQLFGGVGTDSIHGNIGSDTYYEEAGYDTFYGGDGFDTAVYSGVALTEVSLRTYYEAGKLNATVKDIRPGFEPFEDHYVDVESLVIGGRNINLVSAERAPNANFDGSPFDNVAVRHTSGYMAFGRLLSDDNINWHAAINTPGWSARGHGDFDGDGVADTLIQTQIPIPFVGMVEQTLYYSVAKNAFAAPFGLIFSHMKIKGAGDITRDGVDDIVIEDENTHEVLYADAAGGGWSNAFTLNSDYVVRGVGDVRIDGFADIVVQNVQNGTIYAASMGGGDLDSWDVVATDLDHNWIVRAVGDIDGSGSADVVIQHSTSGEIFYARMAGDASAYRLNWVRIGDGPVGSWQVRGTADIDADGREEVLIQSEDDKVILYATTNFDGTFHSWHNLTTKLDTGWDLV